VPLSADTPSDPSSHPPDRTPEAENDLEVRVFAAMRSGHHAVIHWLLCHFAGPVLFRNNALGAEHRVYLNAGEDYVRADSLRPQPKDCYLFNLEDRTVEEVVSLLIEQRSELAWGRSRRVVALLVLRDLPNFIASRLKADGTTIPGFPCDDWAGLWASHAREFAGLSAAIPGLVKVSFNAWASDEGYRRSLSARLGLAFTDAGRDHVPLIGAGSSFDLQRYDGRAREMAVLSRWREVAADPDFLAFTADAELRYLSALLFGLPEEPWTAGRRPIAWRRLKPFVRQYPDRDG
jgi:hypothetical protein